MTEGCFDRFSSSGWFEALLGLAIPGNVWRLVDLSHEAGGGFRLLRAAASFRKEICDV